MGLGKGVAQRNRAVNVRRTAPSSRARGGRNTTDPGKAAASVRTAAKSEPKGSMKSFH